MAVAACDAPHCKPPPWDHGIGVQSVWAGSEQLAHADQQSVKLPTSASSPPSYRDGSESQRYPGCERHLPTLQPTPWTRRKNETTATQRSTSRRDHALIARQTQPVLPNPHQNPSGELKQLQWGLFLIILVKCDLAPHVFWRGYFPFLPGAWRRRTRRTSLRVGLLRYALPTTPVGVNSSRCLEPFAMREKTTPNRAGRPVGQTWPPRCREDSRDRLAALGLRSSYAWRRNVLCIPQPLFNP